MKLVNQQLIKDTNLKRIYNYIFQSPGISRAALAKKTRLSKATISTLIDELINKDFIYDSGTSISTSVGRKPNNLFIKKNRYFAIVVSWERFYINIHLVDTSGDILTMESIPLAEGENYAEILKSHVHHIILSQMDQKKIIGVCVILPAMIDKENQEIYSTTLTMPPIGGAELLQDFSDAFLHFPVILLNDTACFAYAEKVFTNIEQKDFAVINFDLGIGATIFVKGKMLGSATGSYTQFGHFSIDPLGDLCPCGNHGCLEVVIGEQYLTDRVARIGISTPLSALSNITYADLGNASIQGDEAANQLIGEMAYEFTFVLSNMVVLMNPKLIIMGGKSTGLGPVFLEEVQKNIKIMGFRKMMDHIEVRYSKLDLNTKLNGAVKYFFDRHYQFTQDLSGNVFIG